MNEPQKITYNAYLKIPNPEKVGRGGMLDLAFNSGYNGTKLPRYIPKFSLAYGAYLAGKKLFNNGE